jgi:circadian clock protein KaiA
LFNTLPQLAVSSEFPTRSSHPPLLICAFSSSGQLVHELPKVLVSDRYRLLLPPSQSAFFRLLEQEAQQIDCLIFQSDALLPTLVQWLHDQAILLPTVILLAGKSEFVSSQDDFPPDPAKDLTFLYHTAERRIPKASQGQMDLWIDRAIAEFLHLSPSCRLPSPEVAVPNPTADLSTQNFLLLQQRRLAEKLKERLGYLGVYYKRNARNFLRNLTTEEGDALIADLTETYRIIILGYFSEDAKTNQNLDAFVDAAFLADVSVAQVVEIHMDLMGEFAKQLRLEGRSEDILLDYRLTLIDTLAHLCEMYRRSIPKESPGS